MKKNTLALAALMLALYAANQLVISNDDGNDENTTLESSDGEVCINISTEEYNWLCQHGTEPATGVEMLADVDEEQTADASAEVTEL